MTSTVRVPTEAQRAVLEWLWRWPGVAIHHELGQTYVNIMPRWASDDARRHMMLVMGEAFGLDVSSETTPRWSHRVDGATPRITFQTFRALVARRWIRRSAYVWDSIGQRRTAYHYQVSAAGKRVILASCSPRRAEECA